MKIDTTLVHTPHARARPAAEVVIYGAACGIVAVIITWVVVLITFSQQQEVY